MKNSLRFTFYCFLYTYRNYQISNIVLVTNLYYQMFAKICVLLWGKFQTLLKILKVLSCRLYNIKIGFIVLINLKKWQSFIKIVKIFKLFLKNLYFFINMFHVFCCYFLRTSTKLRHYVWNTKYMRKLIQTFAQKLELLCSGHFLEPQVSAKDWLDCIYKLGNS